MLAYMWHILKLVLLGNPKLAGLQVWFPPNAPRLAENIWQTILRSAARR